MEILKNKIHILSSQNLPTFGPAMALVLMDNKSYVLVIVSVLFHPLCISIAIKRELLSLFFFPLIQRGKGIFMVI